MAEVCWVFTGVTIGATTATGGVLTTVDACGVIAAVADDAAAADVGVDVDAAAVLFAVELANVASGFSVTTLSHCSTRRLAKIRTPENKKIPKKY